MMRLSKILAMAWENMEKRKLRTSLTTLGVVIGITAIIGLASLGEGFRLGIKERMQQGFELDVLIVIPGSFTAGIGEFTPREVSDVRNVTGINLVTPLITIPKARVYNNESKRLNALTVAAVNFSEITQMLPERLIPIEGEIPNQEENDTIVLGYKACFLNETEPLVHVGEKVTIYIQAEIQGATNSTNISRCLRVAAILGKSGTSGITNFDYWTFIPIETFIDMTNRKLMT